MTFESISAQQTQSIGLKFGKRLRAGLICLYGELGAGKTTFVQGLAKGLGVKSKIQSPTFTYCRIHKGRIKLYHFDCYRLTKPDPLFLNELLEAYNQTDVVIALEWANRIARHLPKNRTDIFFEYQNPLTRKIKFVNHVNSPI